MSNKYLHYTIANNATQMHSVRQSISDNVSPNVRNICSNKIQIVVYFSELDRINDAIEMCIEHEALDIIS